MSAMAIDPGIVGPSYQATMTLQDAENCINFYVEIAEIEGAKEPIALLGTPGLNAILSTQVGQVRGLWVLPGGSQMLCVSGNMLYVIKVQVPATQTSIAQLTATAVGTLLTNSGPVCIRDNGVLFNGLGGYAVIVDGQYAYWYLLSGTAYSFTFSGSLSINSNTITLPGSLPNGLISGTTATLTDASGVIPANTTISSVSTSLLTVTMSKNATGNSFTDTVTLNVAVFGQITDAGYLGADRIAFIEGWLIFNQTGTRTFFTTGPTPYQMLFPGAFYSLKDSSTDNLITLFENNRELWLIGERTSEVWYNAGGTNFTFSRVPGVGPQIGCSAKHSITRLGPNLIWLAKNEQGENIVVQTQQYAYQRVSNHAVEHAISQYPVVSDAIGYAYEEEGHAFYVLIFPTANQTWVYDFTASALMGKACWHQRLSFVNGQYGRHWSNCYADFQNLRVVGDYQTGQLYQMSRSYYSDNGNPLRAQRRAKHVWKKPDRTRVSQTSLQVEFTPGVGLQTGQGQSPQCMLRWSHDGGFKWSNEQWRTIGAAGATTNRAKWNRLGQARDTVYEINISDPVPRDVIGATLYGETEE